MFTRLVQKELLHHLLDFRFVVVFALCAVLSALSLYVGGRNYARQLREYNVVSENNRRAFQEASLDKGRLFDLVWVGYPWNRRPEALSPVVYGLSGVLGREVRIRYQLFPLFKASTFETDPIHMLFEVLDLAFIVKMVLSLCVLLFTYDAICGEKEAGTLRLYSSFPVARSTLALAKLVGSTLAVLVPFVFAFLLAAAVLALSPEVGLEGGGWGRIAALMGVFGLYLAVFAAFGLVGICADSPADDGVSGTAGTVGSLALCGAELSAGYGQPFCSGAQFLQCAEASQCVALEDQDECEE